MDPFQQSDLRSVGGQTQGRRSFFKGFRRWTLAHRQLLRRRHCERNKIICWFVVWGFHNTLLRISPFPQVISFAAPAPPLAGCAFAKAPAVSLACDAA